MDHQQHHSQAPTQRAGCGEGAEPAARSRWAPKPEQILILESIFNSGMVNPPKDETVRIRKLLQRFGPVADANVFYWFQNRRSRSRRRQRQLQQQAQQLAQAHQAPAALSQSAPVAAQYGGGGYSSSSSSSSTWPPSSPPSAGIMMDGGGGDDLFAISRQMGYGSGSSSSAPAAMAHEQSQMYYGYSYQQQAAGGMNNSMIQVYINGVATEVPRGPVDVRAMFGDDAVLVHAAGGMLPVDDYGVLLHSLQMGESYFLVSRSA